MVLSLYIKAVFKHWWALMSCALWTALGFYVALNNKPNEWLVRAMIVSATLCLLWAGYLVWVDEHNKATALLLEKEKLEIERDDRTPQLSVVVYEAILTTSFGPTDFFIDAEIANERFATPSLVSYYELRVQRDGKNYVTRTPLRDVSEYQVYCVGPSHDEDDPIGLSFSNYQVLDDLASGINDQRPVVANLPRRGWLHFRLDMPRWPLIEVGLGRDEWQPETVDEDGDITSPGEWVEETMWIPTTKSASHVSLFIASPGGNSASSIGAIDHSGHRQIGRKPA